MSAEEAESLLHLDSEGLPPLHFTRFRGQLWLAENTTGLLVNVATRQLRRLGIWSVRVRGDTYADGTLRVGHVELLREPDNPHDRNAIAIAQRGIMGGYWNKGMARSLAKHLDAGEPLVAMCISTNPPKVIAAEPELAEHLRRLMKRPRSGGPGR